MNALALIATSLAATQAIDGWLVKSSEDRAALSIPPTIFDRVLNETGHAGSTMGYTADQMAGFPQVPFLLRLVTNPFRDVRHVPEYSGLLTDNLLQSGDKVDAIGYLGWSQLDVRAGRDWSVPTKLGEWGAPWIPQGTSPDQALALAFARIGGKGKPPATTGKLGILLTRLIVAAESSSQHLQQAIPPEFKKRTAEEFWTLATAPYLGEANDDNILVPDHASYDLQRRFDANYAGFGSARILRSVQAALTEFDSWTGDGAAPKSGRYSTAYGDIVIGGAGDDVHRGDAFLVLDVGGNDSYTGRVATPPDPRRPVSIVIDLAGDDRYGGPDATASVACGLGGTGLLIDRAGNDLYQAKQGGIGAGVFGMGLLLDQAGDDRYHLGKTIGIGAAYFGVGVVSDLAGNDEYRAVAVSMGFGGTFGFGAVIEREGNDDYKTADEGNPSVAWGGKTVSLSLGCGYGRRADYGDGHLQGGGIGAVVDGRGDDRYHSSIFTMGSGYWWGFGIMEDRAGNDTYRCTHYSLGSGAHFALGSFVDLAGDDRYNDRPDAVERWGALGRDGSIATCFDGGGNDVWGNLTGGHSDLNSLSVFWDRDGNDIYKRMQPFDPQSFGNRPFGSAVPYTPFRNFRDRMISAGVFLDTGGRDVYPPGMNAAEGTTWNINKGPNEFGFGWDR